MSSIPLPESLVTQLHTYEARLRRLETLAALTGAVAGVLVTYVLLFVADRFADTPMWARTVLLVSGALLAGWLAHGWAKRWLWHRQGPAELAQDLQRHFRTLGDRLQGVIELTGTGKDLPANSSPALLRAAVRQVAEESGRFDFRQAVPVRPARRWALVAGVLALLTAAPFVLAPRAAQNALARWLRPWAPIERYTFASLEALPAELVVAHGEAFELACGLRADSEWQPANAVARLGRAEAQTAKINDGRALFRFNGQTQNGTLNVRAGDATREVAIRPLHRPEMRALAAQVQWPAYLGHAAVTVPVPGSSASFLEGSTVRFTGETTRVLQSAGMKMGDAAPAAEVHDASFTTPPQPVTDLVGGLTFKWADTHGLAPVQPYSLRISTTPDAEPRVDVQGLESETAILPHEVLNVAFTAADDFGLKESWIGWIVRPLGQATATGSEGEGARTPGEPMRREQIGSVQFAPAWLGIPENTVIDLAGYAVDYLPGRKPVASARHTVYVLSPAKHAERVRERMDQVLKQLDERIRDEERQLEETQAIASKGDELASEKSAEDLSRVEAGETANNAQLQKLTDEMRSVMSDALRNKEVPEGTIADWQSLTEGLEQKAAPPMQEAARSLKQAAAQPGARTEAVAEAQKQQQASLDAMRKAAGKMNTTNQNLYARNFYNRLRAAAGEEHKIADGMKELARETVGLKPDEIAEPKRKQFDTVAGTQDAAAKDVDAIVNDIANFLRRAPNEKYAAVHKGMQEMKVVGALNELAGTIRANLGLKSVGRAKQWGDQLNMWAGELQSECKSQGGGEGEMDPDMLELIVAMVRAAQAQDNIREQTVLLEGRKDQPKYSEEANTLAWQEYALRQTVQELREATKFDEVKPTLAKVEELMHETTLDIREPRTDAEVQATQGTIIELLVPPDKKGGKGNSKMQAMMRQMMATATKARSATGNNAKGDSPFAGANAEGATGKDRPTARTVEKAGGANSAGEWPEEFRDQLQAYVQEMEAAER